MTSSATILTALLAVAGLTAMGCDKGTTTTETKTTKTSGTMSGDATADKVNAAAHDVADKARDAGNAMKESATDAGHAVADKTRAMTNSSTTMPAAGTADAGLVAEVTDLYNKATAAIQAGKLDDAQGYVDKLQTYRSKVPADWQSKIDTLVSTFNSAKTRLNSLPGVNGMPH